MTWEIAFVLLLIVGALLCFLHDKLAPDVTALSLFVILLVSGVVPQAKIFGVLANPAPLTVGAMFILSAALVKCGAIDRLAVLLNGLAGFSYFTVIALIVLGVGGLSAFINNTPVVVVLVPVVISLARKMKLPASRFLIPLSYAAVLGGCCTLLGTSTNLLVTGILQSRGEPPLRMFELAWIGLPMLAVGALYIGVFGRFLPKRQPANITLAEEDRREYITEVFVQPGAAIIGRTATEAGLTLARGIRVLEIVRDERSLPLESTASVLAAGDRLVLACRPQGVKHARSIDGLDLAAELKLGLGQISAHEGVLVEGIVAPNSDLIGRTYKEAGFWRRFHLVVLAVHRHGKELGAGATERQLRNGDILLLMGTEPAVERLRASEDLLLVDRPALPAGHPPHHLRIVLGCIAGVILTSSFGWMSIEVAALLACAIVFLTGCLKPRDGYDAIEWNLLFLIYGMLAVGVAMEDTGTSVYVVDRLLWLVNHFVPPEHKAMVMLAAFYLLASVLTEILSNNAVAALMTPLALSLAVQLGVDPRPFVIAVCIAASAAFATPIGYQTNTYVYGVGGYRFSDFLKFGLPLNVLCFIVAIFVIPAVWPF
ncbi:Citrate transporter [Lacunisphaera limnophila]|uniref:Citrate transporter n=1 Tax=Lacunisphaera limnophila TaxID=1838286 RepID=A0A1I7PHI1_9BACT|nr:SLC13 family permease [Lacunisphaera limnophila]AOS43063.1 Citrate transporter [Lacunisphaera limnophila]